MLVLREALNSEEINKFHNRLRFVLEVLIRFYMEGGYLQEYSELFMECMGCIFCEANFNDNENNNIGNAIRISLIELNNSKNQSETLRNRCLITLENITAA